MYLHKLIVVIAAVVVVVSSAAIEPQNDLQAEATNIEHTRQKRAPLLLKHLLIGGLLAKKAAIFGAGGGLVGASIGSALTQKLLNRKQYPTFINSGPVNIPIYRPPVHDNPVQVYPVIPPIYYDHYPVHSPSLPLPPPPPPPLPPSYTPDCFHGPSFYHSSFASANALGNGYP